MRVSSPLLSAMANLLLAQQQMSFLTWVSCLKSSVHGYPLITSCFYGITSTGECRNVMYLNLVDFRVRHEISSFVDQPHVITEVALVKPKTGLFIEEISSLLVICTPVTVLLLGVSFSSTTAWQYQHIKLYATDLSVSTDVEMTSLASTQDGRIFMCGAQDGCLYEFHYQENESWFGKRVQLVNHSVGGVQSLLPRFAALSQEGEHLFPFFPLTPTLRYLLQKESSSWFLI